MPLFQLEVAAALVASALLSASLLVFSKPEEGKIQLPQVAQDGSDTLDDPFNVTKPEDIVDGEPVQEDEFWSDVRVLAIDHRSSLLTR